VTRDRVVSIRLTDEEHAALKRLGRPSEVLRHVLRESARPVERVVIIPATTAPVAPGYVMWMDGAVGQSWPQAVTR